MPKPTLTPQQEICRDLLRRFPKHPTKSLAAKAYKENPSVFTNQEAARTTLRYLRGNAGEVHRQSVATKEFVRPSGKQGDFAKMPKPTKAFKKKWGPIQIVGPIRALVLSDVHVPFHDVAALKAALQYGLDHQANLILLNGDFVDCHAVSHWMMDPRERKFKAELEKGREMLRLIRETFPEARIIYKLGNHEERWEKWMFTKAPEVLDVPDFEFAKLWRLDEFNIECVGERRPIRLGKLNVIHGHEYAYAISNPVNPARGYYNKAKAHCLAGHLHQTSSHTENNIEGHVITVWSSGCLCDLRPTYSPMNKWNVGFAFVTVDRAGRFEVQNMRIVQGKIYQ